MKNSPKLKSAKIGLGLVVLIVGYLFISPPGQVVVTETGQIKGITNKAREALQGKAFWKEQLREANLELEWELSAPQRLAAVDREIDSMLRKADKLTEEMYRENPELRPSTVQRRADALEERAIRIEQTELDRLIDRERLVRIKELRKIIPIAKAKVE